MPVKDKGKIFGDGEALRKRKESRERNGEEEQEIVFAAFDPHSPQFSFFLKPRIEDQTFSSNIVFIANNMGWLNEQTMFDLFEQTSNKVSPHNAFCVYR